MEEEKQYRLEILDGSNWSIWKWQTESVLKAKKLHDVIKNDTKEVDKDHQAHAIIASSLNRSNKMKVVNCKTSKELWERLESLYENKTSFEKCSLLGKLHNYRIRSSADLGEAISEIQDISAKLNLLKEPVSDNMIASIILKALPANYKSFIMSWKMVTESERTLNNLISNIMALADDDKMDDKAYMARGRKNSRYKNKSFKRSNDDNNRNVGTAPRNGYNKVACTFCKKSGHLEKDCFSKQRQNGHYSNNRRDIKNNGINNNDRGQFSGPRNVSFLAKADQAQTVPSVWIVDSGSTCHMTSNHDWLSDYKDFEAEKNITLGDDHQIKAKGSGNIETTVGTIRNVYYVPEISENLFSVLSTTQHGITGVFNDDNITFNYQGNEVAKAFIQDGAYVIQFDILKQQRAALRAATIEEWHRRLGHVSRDTIRRMIKLNAVEGLNIIERPTSNCEDCALGKCHKSSHPSKSTTKASKAGIILHLDTVGPISITSKGGANYFLLCKDEYSKYRMVRFIPDKSLITNEVKQLISKAQIETGNKVLQIVTDNGTEFVNNSMKRFLQERGINHLRSVPYSHEQNGFIERDIRTVIESTRTMLNNSKLPKNLWGEAVNTAVYALNRSLSSQSDKVPYELWFGKRPKIDNLLVFGQEVVVQIPEEKRRGKHMKFDNKGIKVNFVGYTDIHNTYRVYNSTTKIVEQACDVTPLTDRRMNDLYINNREDIFIMTDHDRVEENEAEISSLMDESSSGSTTNLDETIIEANDASITSPLESENKGDTSEDTIINVTRDSSKSTDVSPIVQSSASTTTRPRSSTFDSKSSSQTVTQSQQLPQAHSVPNAPQPGISQAKTKTSPFRDAVSLLIPKKIYIQNKPPEITQSRLRPRDGGNENKNDDPKDKLHSKLSMIENDTDPTSFNEATNRSDKEFWIQAMQEELDSLNNNEVWELVDRPNGNVVTNKWVYKVKRKPDGKIDRYKARLVARGFSQIYGIDYHETYAPVASMVSIRLLLAHAAVHKLETALFDVKTAFLYGQLDETIHMEQPEGFITGDNKVCLLKKSLYGLKQAPRQWNIEFTTFITDMNLKVSKNDSCIFYKHNPTLIIALYVDDGIIFAENKEDIKNTLDTLKTRFDIHSVDDDSYLGFQIHRGTNGDITIHQSTYIEKILKRFKMENSKSMDAPISITPTKMIGDTALSKTVPYREAIGSLMYAAVMTRIDIMHAVCKAARHMADPKESDWKAVKRIFRYLQGKENFGITYSRTKDRGLVVYCDADFAGDKESNRSTTGSVTLYAGAPIYWRSQRQSLITLSSTEAEYVSLCNTVKDTIWLRKLARELDIINTEKPTLILCDNESAIRIASNEKSSHRTRHMSVQAAYPREQIDNGEIEIQHVKTDYQLADMLTKPTTTQKYVRNRNMLMTTSAKLLQALIYIMLYMTLVQSLPMQKVNPVLWLPTEHFIQTGIVKYEINWHIGNPCELIPKIPNMTNIDPPDLKDPVKTLYRGLKDNCEKFLRDRFTDVMIKIVSQTKPQTFKRKKRGMFDLVGGFVIGVCVTNLISTIFSRINPNSEYNRLGRTEEEIRKIETERMILERRVDHDEHLQLGILQTLQNLTHKVNQQQMKLNRLIDIIPHFTWYSSYIHSRIEHSALELEEVLKEYTQGRLATRQMANLLNYTKLADIDNMDTRFEDIEWLTPYSHVKLVFTIADRARDTSIHKVYAIRHWRNLDTKPIYVEYVGPPYVMSNTTNSCVLGIAEPMQRGIVANCDQPNYEDPQLESWKIISDGKDMTNGPRPFVYPTPSGTYVYCLYNNITFMTTTIRCPPYTFKVDPDSSFSIGTLKYHTDKVHLTTQNRVILDSLDIGKYHFSDAQSEDELKLIDMVSRLRGRIESYEKKEKNMIWMEPYSKDYWLLVSVFAVSFTFIIVLLYYSFRKDETVVYATVRRDRTTGHKRSEHYELVDKQKPSTSRETKAQSEFPDPPEEDGFS